MRKMLFRAMALFMAATMSISLAGCGDDKDDPVDPAKKTETVVVDYSMSLSPDYYELWDIEVSYTNPGGTTTTVTTPIDWKYELNLQTADEIPSKYAFTVTAKPKATAPALEADKIYTLSSECFVKITCLSSEGTVLKTGGMVVPKTETKSTSGSHLEEAVKADRKIFSGEFTVAID